MRDSERVSSPLERGWPRGHSRLNLHAILKNFNAHPTHPWRYVHRDEQEDKFTPNSPTSSTRATRLSKRAIQDEVCNDTREEASKARVMENGIKSPSLRNRHESPRNCT